MINTKGNNSVHFISHTNDAVIQHTYTHVHIVHNWEYLLWLKWNVTQELVTKLCCFSH